MANPGIGTKFASVNLNKSYGKPSSLGGNNNHNNNNNNNNNNNYNGSSIAAGSSSSTWRGRASNHGGMVVLSRQPRGGVVSGQKAPRLSVPPPLNLPSLRSEHQGLDPSAGGVVVGRGGASGASGSGPGIPASVMGWTKPPAAASQEKDNVMPRIAISSFLDSSTPRVESPSSLHTDSERGGTIYMPPAARVGNAASGGPIPEGTVRAYPSPSSVVKAVVLRGEDFPSLQASIPSAAAPYHKQKELNQKQKQKHSNETSNNLGNKQNQDGTAINQHRISSDSRSPLHMRPQMKSRFTPNSSEKNSGFDHVSGGFGVEQSQWQEGYLPGPLPVVRRTRTADWADDERDTGHAKLDRDRDHGFHRAIEVQGSRDRELDFSRSGWPRIGTTGVYSPLQYRKNGLSQTLGPDREIRDAVLSDARGLREVDSVKFLSRDIVRGDPYDRETLPNREIRDGNSWRGSTLQKDGFASRETGVHNRNAGSATMALGLGKENGKDNKYDRTPYGRGISQSPAGENAWDGFSGVGNGTQDSSRYTREPYKRDSGYGQVGQNGSIATDAFSTRGSEQNVRFRYGDPSNRFRGAAGDVFQNSKVPRSSFSSGSKGLPLNDPILSFGREKRLFSNNSKPYLEDPFMKDFPSSPGSDPFSGGLVADVKLLKKKKDALKQADFHDPIRESFEAELDRVQKMQEQERQRVLEEQARALDLARKEEEERVRLVREEEERRRRLEEEAREAAWLAEQERLEAARRAEEQKMAREEEKRRILLEEERRKEAAKKKLLELEARIARRQAEATKEDKLPPNTGDDGMVGMMKERDMFTRVEVDAGDMFEDGERMVEQITGSASSDSLSMNNRPFEMDPRILYPLRDVSSTTSDRGRHSNLWKRDMLENGNGLGFLAQDQDNYYCSPKRDGFGGGRGLPRKELYGGSPGISSNTRIFSKTGISEPPMPDDFPHLKGQQRWNYAGDGDHYDKNLELDAEYHDSQMDKFSDIGWGQGRSRSYPERLFQNSEDDGFSFGRSRHSVRQPRVLPPPPLTSMQKISWRATDTEQPGSSSFIDSETSGQLAVKKNDQIVESAYGSGFQERLEQSEVVGAPEESIISEEKKEEKCVAQRCDSQSSLSVSSPPDSPTHLSHDDLEDAVDSPVLLVDRDQSVLPGRDNAMLASDTRNTGTMMALNSSLPGEDEEWVIGNDEELQEQEEYDEEEDAYQEDGEVHEGDNSNLVLAQEFEDLHLKEENYAGKIGQPQVFGFDEGVGVGILNSDDSKRSAIGNGEKETVQPISVDGIPKPIPFNAQTLMGVAPNGNEGHGPQLENGFSEIGTESSSKMVQETQKALEDLVLQPMNDPQISVASTSSYVLDGVEASSSSGMPMRQPLSLVANPSSPSPAIQPMFSAVSAIPCQAEVPVKLQFGLFSGPSLIPSPVPAIQIGSIQMPLHLHPQVGASLTQIHPSSQPPFFQFGQLRYTSPISQGLLPLATQTMSFVQPTVSTHYPFGQKPGDSLHIQDSSIQNPHLKDKEPAIQPEDQASLMDNQSQENLTKDLNKLPVADCVDKGVLPSQSSTGSSVLTENKIRSQGGDHGSQDGVKKLYRSVANGRVTQDQLHTKPISSQHFPGERAVTGSQASGTLSGTKGKRYVYSVRNTGSKPSFPSTEASQADSGSFQRWGRRSIRRTEFRVRENVDRRQMESLGSSSYRGQNEKSTFNTRIASVSAKVGGRRDAGLNNKLTKHVVESEIFLSTGSSSSHIVDSKSKRKQVPLSKRKISLLESSHVRDGYPKRNINSEEDVDGRLQIGVVRVFKQPGIEAPSDDDDFIEVRSKRQMLNDRREQREKEIKAKTVVIKTPRKPRSVLQNDTVSSRSNRAVTSLGAESGPSGAAIGVCPVFSTTDGRSLIKDEGSTGSLTCTISQPLPSIVTSAVIIDSQADTRSLETSDIPVITNGGTNLVPGLSFENQNVALCNTSTSSLSWCSGHINQQVMTLTQTQLDEAMKPARFDTHATSLCNHSGLLPEPCKTSTSIMTQDKSFSSAIPLNSLLAGEKIQFGAVTSPSILPPSSLSVSNGIAPPVLCMLAPESDCVIYFDKGRHDSDEPCGVQLEDPEAEAEAAASAVAVAAITSDEIVGNGLDPCSGVSVTDAKSFAVSGLPSGGGGTSTRPLTDQARGEESLTVALPADLSVENPALSLWPSLPSPHNSSNAMLSHFTGAPPSHFPCYEMNPMLGSPIFAFAPQDETAGTQSQSQKSGSSGSGLLGPWQQCHSGMDSFYGPPAGFTGPFISPSGGIPGPPHMVVYNHFAPVGQYGQVGLSFMGTTYLPSGKQPDWKHTPVSSSAADVNSMNMVPGQRMPAPIQHLASGSSLMPMASPLAMFDMSPFQTSADIPVGPVQASWSHVPASPLRSVPLSMPLQQQHQQIDGGSTVPSQFRTHALAMEASSSRFHEVRSSKVTDGGNTSCRNFPAASVGASHFPDELELGNSSSGSGSVRPASYSSSLNSKAQNGGKSSSSRSAVTNSGEGGGIDSSNKNSSNQLQQTSVAHQQYLHPIGYSGMDQRGSVSQKMGSGNEWQRRIGFQGRNQTTAGDKNLAATTKMKQIYVAKPTNNSATTTTI